MKMRVFAVRTGMTVFLKADEPIAEAVWSSTDMHKNKTSETVALELGACHSLGTRHALVWKKVRSHQRKRGGAAFCDLFLET